MIEHRKGSIFRGNDAGAIVVPVNCVGKMESGLAQQARVMYPDYYADYVAACNKGEMKIGTVRLYKHARHPAYIISFPTRFYHSDPVDLGAIRSGMLSLVTEVMSRTIQSLAIPTIGAEKGELEWEHVLQHINRRFEGMGGMTVFVYGPSKSKLRKVTEVSVS